MRLQACCGLRPLAVALLMALVITMCATPCQCVRTGHMGSMAGPRAQAGVSRPGRKLADAGAHSEVLPGPAHAADAHAKHMQQLLPVTAGSILADAQAGQLTGARAHAQPHALADTHHQQTQHDPRDPMAQQAASRRLILPAAGGRHHDASEPGSSTADVSFWRRALQQLTAGTARGSFAGGGPGLGGTFTGFNSGFGMGSFTGAGTAGGGIVGPGVAGRGAATAGGGIGGFGAGAAVTPATRFGGGTTAGAFTGGPAGGGTGATAGGGVGLLNVGGRGGFARRGTIGTRPVVGANPDLTVASDSGDGGAASDYGY